MTLRICETKNTDISIKVQADLQLVSVLLNANNQIKSLNTPNGRHYNLRQNSDSNGYRRLTNSLNAKKKSTPWRL
jgi:hypothetical protein